MTQITYRVDQDILYISVTGRVDASNAPAVEKEIFRIKDENPGKHTVIDADNLEYISSAGLRVILKLRKEEPKLAIINVSPEVYDIFDMTGFTDIVTVEKAYLRMSVDGCEFIAKGANGAVYRYDNETIVKTYYNKDALPESKYMMHGDYHTNNIMVQNGETLLIDMDTLSVGCPVLEFGSMYNAFVGFSELDHENVKGFLGFDFNTAGKFWKMSLARYLGTEDESVINSVEEKAKVIGYTRILRRSIRKNDTQANIEHYKNQLVELLGKVDTLNF